MFLSDNYVFSLHLIFELDLVGMRGGWVEGDHAINWFIDLQSMYTYFQYYINIYYNITEWSAAPSIYQSITLRIQDTNIRNMQNKYTRLFRGFLFSARYFSLKRLSCNLPFRGFQLTCLSYNGTQLNLWLCKITGDILDLLIY